MQFPIENISPTSPVTSGMQNALNIYSQFMQALQAPEQMAMQKQMQQADLLQKQLANKYYPQMTEADINAKLAGTAQTQEQTKLAPINTAVELQNALTSAYQNQRMAQQRNWAWGLQRALSAMPQNARDSWIADHQDEYNAMIQSIMQSGQQSGSSAPMILTPDFLKQSGFPAQQQSQMMQPQAPQGDQAVGAMLQTNVQPQQTPAMVGSGLPGAPQSAMQVNPNQLTPQQMQDIGKVIASNPTASQDEDNPFAMANNTQGQFPEWVDPKTGRPQLIIGGEQPQFTSDQRQQVATMMSANRASTGPQIQNRLQGAVALANFMYDPEIQKELVTLSKYSGLVGKSEAYIKSKLKPEEMAEFNNAKNRLPLLISGSVKSLENLPTSNLGMQAGGDFLNISQNQKAWVNNPDATLKDWLAAYKLADSEERAILKSAQPLYEVYKLPEKPPSIIQGALSQQPSVAQQLAEKTGMKAPSEKSAASTSIPSFNSKSEFQAWFKQQSPAVQAEIKQKMGAQ